jgi:hypothetical protein
MAYDPESPIWSRVRLPRSGFLWMLFATVLITVITFDLLNESVSFWDLPAIVFILFWVWGGFVFLFGVPVGLVMEKIREQKGSPKRADTMEEDLVIVAVTLMIAAVVLWMMLSPR